MINQLLVPLDGSAVAESALPHAAAIARRAGAAIVLARVPEQMVVPVVSGGVWLTRIVESEEAHSEAAEYLAEVAARPLLAGLQVTTEVAEYPVVDGLLRLSETSDLIVMTSHGRTAAERWVFGSVAAKLLRGASTDTYVVRATKAAADGATTLEPAAPVFRKILVPLDGSALAETALGPAVSVLEPGGMILLATVPTVPGIIKVIPETAGLIPDALRDRALEAETYLGGVAERLTASGISAATEVAITLGGSVADGLLDHGREVDADLIVLTSHGRSGLGRWLLGSVAERLVSASELPVWVHRTGAEK